ncbi:MAG: response regulator [Planctomycetes bacterium]|nr:response regulator [Planctomycetota bacterium]MCB9886847.1 response regulator [Planctomycetota bacterium]
MTFESSSPQLRVLLVEDEPTIAITLGDELEENGYRVTCVADGREAIGLLDDQAFDAVITDLRLPGASGLDVLRAARSGRPQAKVLVITAFAPPELEALRRAGAVLAKPFPNRSVLDWLAAQVA